MLTSEPAKAAEVLVLAKYNAREIRRQLDVKDVTRPLAGLLPKPRRGPNPYVEVQPQDFPTMQAYYDHMIAKIPAKYD